MSFKSYSKYVRIFLLSQLLFAYLIYLIITTWGSGKLAEKISNNIEYINCKIDCKANAETSKLYSLCMKSCKEFKDEHIRNK